MWDNHLKISRIVFTQLCEILFWSYISSLAEDRDSIALTILCIVYFYLCNRVYDLDLFIIDMAINKRNQIRAVSKMDLAMLLSCNIIVLPLLTIPKSFLALLILHIMLPVVFRKIYYFFLDIFIVVDSKTFKSKILCIMYSAVKLLHFLLLLVLPIVYLFVCTCGYIDYLHQDKGMVHYNFSSVDGNHIRKCDRVEHLSTVLHSHQRNILYQSNMCSAIPREYVTFSCNVTKHFLTDDIIFQWMKGSYVINESKRYKITFLWQKDLETKQYIASSNLTTYLIKSVDFNTYKCQIKAFTYKRLTVKQMFYKTIVHANKVCSLTPKHEIVITRELSIVNFKGLEHAIQAPIGYLLKLENAFPLNVNDTVSSVKFINGHVSFDSPFEYCYTSVSQYHRLDEKKPDQFPVTMFCMYLYYGRYFLQVNFKSGATIFHPNSLYIQPSVRHTRFSLFHDRTYLRLVNSSTFYTWNDRAYLINTSEVLFYYYKEFIENVMWLFLLYFIAFFLYIEIKGYTYLLNVIRKQGEINACDPVHKTAYDIFFSFCEHSNHDQTFAVEYVLPYLEDKYKVRSCHLINAGVHSLEQCSEEIQRCKKVVILWSKDYAEDCECKNILSSVILGLHCNELLKLNDIITLRYDSYPVAPRYSFFLNENCVDVPGDLGDSLDIIHDCLMRSFANNEGTMDKLRSYIIVKLFVLVTRVIISSFASINIRNRAAILLFFVILFVIIVFLCLTMT